MDSKRNEFGELQLGLPFELVTEIILSERDYKTFTDTLNHPPAPNARLKALITHKPPHFLELSHSKICINCTCGLKGHHGSKDK